MEMEVDILSNKWHNGGGGGTWEEDIKGEAKNGKIHGNLVIESGE